VTENSYLVRPKAHQDLDDLAFYYATESNPELGHRFLVAAHETFSLVATQLNMGWRPRLRNPNLHSLRVFRVTGFKKILILYLPLARGIEVLRVVHGSRNIQVLLNQEWLE
jgi:toxin ParE1/3/4